MTVECLGPLLRGISDNALVTFLVSVIVALIGGFLRLLTKGVIHFEAQCAPRYADQQERTREKDQAILWYREHYARLFLMADHGATAASQGAALAEKAVAAVV